MKICRNQNVLHPVLVNCMKKIQVNVIDAHNMPIRLFETGRQHDRHEMLIHKGKTKDIVSRHLYNLENVPPLSATAVDYVYFDPKWAWNLRDSTTNAWYILFGNMVLDLCPELQWAGMNRKSVNFCHFELLNTVMVANLDKVPCVTY